MRPSIVAALFVSCLLTALPARADLITIDPNDYAIGTDISTLIPGLTIQRLHYGPGSITPIYSPVFVGQSIDPSTFDLGGASFVDNYLPSCSEVSTSTCFQFNVIEVRFDSPIDFVEMDSRWLSDSPGIKAYDANNNLVGMCESLFGSDGGGCASSTFDFPASSTILRIESSNISRVVFGGVFGTSTLTSITYSVPEPASLMLVALGAGGLFTRRRRTPRARS